jgi:hypothetical protein
VLRTVQCPSDFSKNFQPIKSEPVLEEGRCRVEEVTGRGCGVKALAGSAGAVALVAGIDDGVAGEDCEEAST